MMLIWITWLAYRFTTEAEWKIQRYAIYSVLPEFGIGSTNNLLTNIFLILITCLLDIVLMLYGEILSWSLMGIKGLKPLTEADIYNDSGKDGRW